MSSYRPVPVEYVEMQNAHFSGERWQRVKLLMTMAALLILATAAVALVQGNRLHRRIDRGDDVQQSVDALREFSRVLVDMETGQRGYLLTGDITYLAPYRDAERKLPELVAHLTTQLERDSDARVSFAAIRKELQHKKMEMDMAISIFHESGRDAAIEYIRSDFGKALMSELRRNITALTLDQEALAKNFRDQSISLIEQRNWTIFVIALLGLIAGMTGHWLVRGHLRQLALEATLRAQAQSAISANNEKTSFLADMSHEIRTPMNAIFGFTQLLEEIVEGERQRFYVKAIQQSGQALLDLINDILDLSRIEAGKLEVELAPTDLRELFASLQTMFSQMAMEKGLRLRHKVDADVPDALLLDPRRLRQIMINLIGNAIKYTDHGEVTLHVSAEVNPDDEQFVQCTMAVTDTGTGIAAADLTRVFEPFTQVESSSEKARSGTGLGLSIVKRLSELLGGRISIESVVDSGTTVRLHFDQVAITVGRSVEPTVGGHLRELAPLRIVAVDDVVLNRNVFEGIFANTHHTLHVASGGAEGVDLVRRERPDLVLMDIRMPEVDGVEALRRIRSDAELAGVVVVAVTASSLLGEESRLRDMFDGYVRKPITRQALFDELSRLFAATDKGCLKHDPNVDEDASMAEQAIDVTRRSELIAALQSCREKLDIASQTHSSSDVDELLACMRALVDGAPVAGMQARMDRIARDAALFDLRGLEANLDELRSDVDRRIAQLRTMDQEPKA